MSDTRMFLDASGSAPLTPRVTDALRVGFADGWADPNRLHVESRRARALVDGARGAIADVIGTQSEYLHFTASVSLGFERVVTGICSARRGRDRIVASAIERDAMLDAATFATKGEVDLVPVDRLGHLDLDALSAFTSDPATAMAAVQHANHEVATVQRLTDVAAVTSHHSVPLVVDATASIGHIESPQHWDALVANPADWGGPAGLGVVALRPQTRWLQAWPDGDPWAPGGISVPLALAAAVALQERVEERERTATRLSSYIDEIRTAIDGLEDVTVIGDSEERLPHVLTAAFLYLDGEPLVSRLDRAGIAVGSGSACGKATFEPSRVLEVMGALTHGNLRIGLHPGVTHADVRRFIGVLPRVIADVKSDMGVLGS
ncbi:cysteine desulfurase family protein [Demequina aurantiaca]|uniref:cysteine desulfurase family protein n=1 Tax=Demequina aurantiaca TaxID=676200 RepID=UPI0007857A25|nr:aminotransferase class V-fold PLP-dependent enzyme [Demequina aurantiaca]